MKYPCFLLFPQPIAFTSDIDGSGVVKQSIQYSRSDDIIGEDTVLFSVRLTTGDANRALLMVPGHQLEEKAGSNSIQRQVIHLINNA